MVLHGDNNSCTPTSLNIHKNIDIFNKSYKKNNFKRIYVLVYTFNYHPTIPATFGLPRIPKNHAIPLLLPMISGMGTAPHNIAKSIAKFVTPLLGKISPSYQKKWQPLQQNKKYQN